MKVIVLGMTCGHCVRAITATIGELDPAAQVTVDLTSSEVDVAGQRVSPGMIVSAIQDAGYSARLLEAADSQTKDQVTDRTCCGLPMSESS